ncbi:hypothetical protein FOZ63_017352, partial [Perkinsus olseni]
FTSGPPKNDQYLVERYQRLLVILATWQLDTPIVDGTGLPSVSQWHKVLPNRVGAHAHKHLASILKQSVTTWTEQANTRRFWESFIGSPPSRQATMGPSWQQAGIEALADNVRQKWIQYLSSEGWATTEALETRASARSPLYPVLMETLLRVTSPVADSERYVNWSNLRRHGVYLMADFPTTKT